MKKKSHLYLVSISSLVATLFQGTEAQAQQFQSMGDALKKVLGAGSKAFKKTLAPGRDVFYSKSADGKPQKLAFVEKGIYPPNCTHTWVVGVDAGTSKVTGIEVVEMGCPHAFPTREKSYLDQYVGKGPVESKTLIKQIDTIAKATGSCNLTTEAVVRSVTDAVKSKGQL